MRPDRYFLRGRASAYVLEGELRVEAGETRTVEDNQLERVEYARLVRKGGSVVTSAGGALAGYSLRGPLASGAGACHGLFAAYALVWPELTLTPRLDACTGSFENANVRAAVYELGGDVRIAHAWDFPVVSVDVGFAVGASWLRQSFTTRGTAPARDSLALRSSVGPTATFELGSGLLFTLDVAAETYAFRQELTATRADEFTAALAFRARAGVGKQG